MSSSTAPNPSAAVQNETQNARKRTGSELSDDGREAKKVKVESDRAKLKAKGEKDKGKKKKRRKTRRSSVVMVEAKRSVSKPRSTTTQPASAPQALSSATDAADAEPEEKIISSVDKGKGKATSPEPGPSRVASPSIQPEASTSTAHYASEIARLKEQVASQTELIQRHETHINATQQSLTCQICLDLLYKPYALAACGHITCYGCLVRWFTAPANPTENHLQGRPIEEILSSTLARNGAYLRRKKNCPVCRANVIERPAELWDIKSMVQALVRSKLVELPATTEEPAPAAASTSIAAAAPTPAAGPSAANANANNDPWRSIFPVRPARGGGALDGFGFDLFLPHHMGLHDADDGGIYRCIDCHNEIVDGECSGCGREYAGHDGGDTEHSSDEDDGWPGNARLRALLEEHAHDDEDDLDDEDDPDYPAFGFWGGGHPVFHLPHGDDFSDEEEEDARYGRIFEVATDVVTDVDEDEEADGSDHQLYEVEDEDGSEHGHEDDEDSQYGGSFIDDDELVEMIANNRRLGSDDEDDVEFVELLDGPLRGNTRRPIVVASDNEEGDTDDEAAPSHGSRFWSNGGDPDDEDEDEDEEWPTSRSLRRRPVVVDGTDEEEEEE